MSLILVALGNPCPKNSFAQPEGNEAVCECCGKTDLRHEPVNGPEVTGWAVASSPKGEAGYYSLADCVASITAADGAWANHTWDPDAVPLWVESNSPGLQMILAEHFGCPEGRPDGFVAASETAAAQAVAEQPADAEATGPETITPPPGG